MKKMLIMILCITLCVTLLAIPVMANEIINTSMYNPNGQSVPSGVLKTGNAIIGILQTVGTIFAVAMLLYLGIRLMIASPSERADIKSRAVPYIVGAVMLFGIPGLLRIVYNIMQTI